ncbi:RNA polymerase sigma factor [Tabrizicola sp. M-4]|uniref:RNA polymerase sigma factor n=1 Tax=Tabrizicola sp. M-4 TaxID=3055847 RepID=UPI003DA7B6D8
MTPEQALDHCLRRDRGRLIAALATRLRDVQRAEDALHEAAASALIHWPRGIPDRPDAWLLRAALRKAIDALRRDGTAQRHAQGMAALATEEATLEDHDIPDDRLRLIFACCHPALDPKSRTALTLRSICGLTTPEIARAFLDSDSTMGQRLSRAKAKIAAARIPFAIPGPEDWPARLDTVLTTLYLIFTTGYAAGPGEPRDLCAEAIFLARLLTALRPGEAEIEGALALMLLTDARRAARIGPEGATLPPAAQDRRLWNPASIAEGHRLLDMALSRHSPGPYQIKAAIAACHMSGPAPDWPQIAALYTRLMDFEPTPVIRLNRAVALSESGHLPTALAELSDLAATLQDYQPFHAAQAALLARAGRIGDSRAAYDRALALTTSPADAAFLGKARAALPHPQAD